MCCGYEDFDSHYKRNNGSFLLTILKVAERKVINFVLLFTMSFSAKKCDLYTVGLVVTIYTNVNPFSVAYHRLHVNENRQMRS